MAHKSYELHHNFPKLAEEAGFTFNLHRLRTRIDWNKLKLIDIDGLIKDKRYFLIEQSLNDILDCVLESEFDVRILDEGVVKMFRLAQLAVEYQQFCRHYLDRSVFVLREEINSLVQELDATKKELRDKTEEIRKMKRKSKQTYRTPIYTNENIATMILKTLTNKGDIFPSTSNDDVLQYNKCNYCEKVFMNQLYLQSHLNRRHASITELPEKDTNSGVKMKDDANENKKLNDEVLALKSKLKQMEDMINTTKDEVVTTTPIKIASTPEKDLKSVEMKDAEVFTNNEDLLLQKFDEWKREEHEKYTEELNLLRRQILDNLDSLKIKEENKSLNNESKIIEELQQTVKDQSAEINSLKNELINSKLISENEEIKRKNESEQQMLLWTKRIEIQSKQYESLLEKLNKLSREAQESRTMALEEKERAVQLQALLEQNLSNKHSEVSESMKQVSAATTDKEEHIKKKTDNNRKTLEDLHRKAQELLNIDSSSSSDTSRTSEENVKLPTDKNSTKYIHKKANIKEADVNLRTVPKVEAEDRNDRSVIKLKLQKANIDNLDQPKQKRRKNKKRTLNTQSKNVVEHNGPKHLTPGSPVKVLRAKITEEVNNRLVTIGIDPLKSRLPPNVFQKQRMELHQHQELKAKKNPAYEQVKHSILTYLDSSVTDSNLEKVKTEMFTGNHNSPSKMLKSFSFTSVISNVKNKALSLVKTNDANGKNENKSITTEVARRAITMLKTPSESPDVSPIKKEFSPIRSNPLQNNEQEKRVKSFASNNISEINKSKVKRKTKIGKPTSTENKDSNSDTDHKYYNTTVVHSSKSVENLIKSPARKPSSANENPVKKYTIDSSGMNLFRTQSAIDLTKNKSFILNTGDTKNTDRDSSDDMESIIESPIKNVASEEHLQSSPKQTRGVLKNASSTSSLNKKKVIFDMDAIQMKSVSASPSQSLTDRSDANEKYDLGLVNLDDEEWDISSIENEPLKIETKTLSRTSPKIAELKNTIESQLASRKETPTTLVGGVDVLRGPLVKTASIGGSNTSLGSSILDESETSPAGQRRTVVKPKRFIEKDDSEIDISEFSIDKLTKNMDESF